MATDLVIGIHNQRYRGYARRHGFVVLSLMVLAVVIPTARTAAFGGLALATAAYLAGLWAWGRELRSGGQWLPHAVTATRGVAAVVVLGLAAGLGDVVLDTSQRWMLLAVLAIVEATDLIDGYLARRLPDGGSFGKTWDMECDAAFMVALVIASWLWAGTYVVVLAFGAMRYVYVSLCDRSIALPDPPARYASFAKTVAAASAVAVLFSLVPTVGPALRQAVLWTVLTALIASFVWDALLQAPVHKQARQSRQSRG